MDGYGDPYTPPAGILEYPLSANRAESYWQEHTVWPETGSVIMGRPFSQHEVPPVPLAGVIPGVLEACDRAPGLRAPV